MKRLLLLCFAFPCLCPAIDAQLQGQAYIDSLLTELPRAIEDTNKVRLLNNLSDKYYRTQPDEGLIYGEQALALAEKLNYTLGIGSAYNKIGFCYFSKRDYPKTQEYLEKSTEIVKALGDKGNLRRNYIGLGLVHEYKNDYQKALDYYLMGLPMFQETRLRPALITVNKNVANMYGKLFDHDHEREMYLQLLRMGEEDKDNALIAFALSNIGSTYYATGNYPRAIESHLAALRLQEKIDNPVEMARVNSRMATAYEALGDHDKSLFYYDKALTWWEKTDRTHDIGLTLSNIGSVHDLLKDDEKALDYYLRALTIMEKSDNKEYLAYVQYNIAGIYNQRKDYIQAINYLRQARQTSSQLNQAPSYALSQGLIGRVYLG
ncbi:MAG: tetratricopeptide repeat protein, partial [Bacteroidota bacterium]|nr:tetratricopeptide repeat protein [Bacteroidota bacterium]